MTTMRILTILLLFLSFCIKSHSNPIDENSARCIALDFLVEQNRGYANVNVRDIRKTRLTRHPLKLHNLSSDSVSCDTLVYIFNLPENQGYIIVSGDDRCKPILGYSFDGKFVEPTNGTIGEQVIRNLYVYVRNVVEGKTSSRSSFLPRKMGLPERVEPLLPNLWDQGDPFNRLCPLIDSVRCVTGCVATAMAQVMHYHRWPLVGNGTLSYVDRLGCQQELSTDFSAHRYDWDNMLYRYDGDFTDKEAEAVSLLMSDCGISVRMRYGIHESGARSVYQAKSLYEHFGYDAGMQMYFNCFYHPYEWHNLFKDELAAGRPILFSGWSLTLAHAFVCDGYDENGMFHFDWGMTGYTNGYYDLDIMTPDQPQWYDKDNHEGGMNLLQLAIVGIKPAEPDSKRSHLFALSHIEILDGKTDDKGEFAVVTHNLCNIGWSENEGQTALALVGMEGNVTPLYVYEHMFDLEEINDTSYTDTISFCVPTSITDGSYRLCVVYDDNGVWKEARTTIGTPNYVNFSVSKGNKELSDAKEAQARLSLVSLDFPDTLIQYNTADYAIAIRNEGADYSGRLLLYCEDINGKSFLLNDVGVFVPKGETIKRSFSRTKVKLPAGHYNLKVSCDIDVLSDSLIVLNEPKTIYVAKEETNDIYEIKISRNNDCYYDLSGRPLPYQNILHSNKIRIRDSKVILR